MSFPDPIRLAQIPSILTEATPLLTHDPIDHEDLAAIESTISPARPSHISISTSSVLEQQDVVLALQQYSNERSHSDLKQFIKTYRVQLIAKMSLFAKTTQNSTSLRAICSPPSSGFLPVEQRKEIRRTLFALSSGDGESDLYKYCCPIGATEYKQHMLFRSAYRGVGKKTFVTLALPAEAQDGGEEQKNITRFITECRYIQQIRHLGLPRIGAMRLVTYYGIDEKICPGALIEDCSYGSLCEIQLGQLTEYGRMSLMEEISFVVAELHRNHKCHMDIRKENIFRTYYWGNIQVRFVNFVFDGIVPRGAFLAPEQHGIVQGFRVEDSPAVDVWQLGDILFFVRFGFSLFEKFLRNSAIDRLAYQRCYDCASRYCNKTNDPFDQFLLTQFSLDPLARPSSGLVLSQIRELIVKNSLSPTLELTDEEEYSCCCLS